MIISMITPLISRQPDRLFILRIIPKTQKIKILVRFQLGAAPFFANRLEHLVSMAFSRITFSQSLRLTL